MLLKSYQNPQALMSSPRNCTNLISPRAVQGPSDNRGPSVKGIKLTIENFKEQISKVKEPFLNQIRVATAELKQKTQQINRKSSQYSSEDLQDEPTESKLCSDESFQEQPLANKQDREEELTPKGQDIPPPEVAAKEWKWGGTVPYPTSEDMSRGFILSFEKKGALSNIRNNKAKTSDFKKDEQRILTEVYESISDSTGLVPVNSVLNFLDSYSHFYLLYNLEPKLTAELFREAAKTQPGMLTLPQFLHVFYAERPVLMSYDIHNMPKPKPECILQNEHWQDLKSIFETLDTFGDQNIYIRPFFNKIRKNYDNSTLLAAPVIRFSEVDRIYTLNKVIFDLENKVAFPERVSWNEISDRIRNFTHIETPTLDEIYEASIKRAEIASNSNYFMLDDNAIAIIKNTYLRCPKYCQSFVKIKYLRSELTDSNQLEPYMNTLVRKNPFPLTLADAIKGFTSPNVHNYIDLDEALAHFSIKGPVENLLKHIQDIYEAAISSTDSEEEKQCKRERKLRRVASLKSPPKRKQVKKVVRQNSNFNEFNLTKRSKPSIREQKVKQMLDQKRIKEEYQLQNKFKAQSIPAGLNPQRYKAYQAKVKAINEARHIEATARRQQDENIIKYFKANTRIFNQPNSPQSPSANNNSNGVNVGQSSPKRKTSYRPAPWFVSEPLLEKIEEKKEERRLNLKKSLEKQYDEVWSKLPDFFFRNQEEESELFEEFSILASLDQFKHKEVPNFELLHRKFKQELERRKQKQRPTQVREFNLTPARERAMSPPDYTFRPEVRPFYSPPSFLNSPSAQVRSTKKFDSYVQLNQVRSAERIKREQRPLKEMAERELRKNRFRKYILKNFQGITSSSMRLQKESKTKLKALKQREAELDEDYINQLAHIYSRALSRPCLYEGVDGKFQKYKAQPVDRFKNNRIKNIEPIELDYGNNEGKGGQYPVSVSPVKKDHQELNQSF